MIRTKTELATTKELLRKFKSTLTAHRKTSGKKSIPGTMAYLTEQGLRGQIQELEYQIKAFEALNKNESVPLRSFLDLGVVLVAARLIKNMTQADLARILGMKQQQIQRYEAKNYTNIAMENLDRIVEALGVNFHKI